MRKLDSAAVDCRNCTHFRRPPDQAKVVILDKPLRCGDWEMIAEGLAPTDSFRRIRYCELAGLLDGDLKAHAGSLARMAEMCPEFKFAPGKGPEAVKEDDNE